MANSNGGSKKHAPGYVCYKNAKDQQAGKAKKTKKIAEGKRKAQEAARLTQR